MPPPPSCVARVAATDGQVTIRRPSEMEFAPAPTHTPLCPGDIVRTGPRSRAILLFSDGSQLKLNAMSMLLIPYATGRRHDAGMAYMRPPMERRPLGERGRSEEERKQTPPPPR